MAAGVRTQDEARADVERALRDAVGLATVLPRALIGRATRCAARTSGRLADLIPPLRLLRSAFDVTLANVVSPAESTLDGTDPTSAPVPTPPAAAAPASTAVDPADAPPSAPSAGGGLPIDEYESLAASQVVARLPALSPAELRTVRDFEGAHRGRRTVLGKIDQLLA
jgi:hypothetical protein